MVVVGPSVGCNGEIDVMTPSSRCCAFSDLRKVHAVKEVTDSLATSIGCLARRSTSTEKSWPMKSGGSDVEKWLMYLGNLFSEAHL